MEAARWTIPAESTEDEARTPRTAGALSLPACAPALPWWLTATPLKGFFRFYIADAT